MTFASKNKRLFVNFSKGRMLRIFDLGVFRRITLSVYVRRKGVPPVLIDRSARIDPEP